MFSTRHIRAGIVVLCCILYGTYQRPEMMTEQLLRALFQAFVPIAAMSFALTWWSVKRGYVSGGGTIKGLKSELKHISKAQSRDRKQQKKGRIKEGNQEKSPKTDVLHKKWLKFGGGFYGVVAFYTYLVIEIQEIVDFVTAYSGFSGLLSNLGPSLLIRFFIESLKNFIAAFVWPATWLSTVPSKYIIIWLAAAWFGYQLGTQLALRQRGG